MKVLLVNTNRMRPPIAPVGLDYLADALTVAGHSPRLLDLCFSDVPTVEITHALQGFAPDVIGITVRNTDDCYFSGQAFFLPEIREIVRVIRHASSAPVVLGGIGFSIAPAATLEFCEAPYGIYGEGELGFVELLRALERKTDLARVPNLVYRDGTTTRRNHMVPLDLAELPPRRRAFVDNGRYFVEGAQAGFETKRGCPLGCIYCADPVAKGHSIRLMPPGAVVAELAALLAQGIDHFHTCDSEFNFPRAHALDVCRAIIDAGLAGKFRWYAYCAPTPFDDEMAAIFQRAGCAGIDFGADSGCDEMLRRLGRHFTTDDLAHTAEVCRRHQIPFMYDLILGGPGETRKSVARTIDFIRRISPDCVGLSLGVRIYEGTPLAREVQGITDARSDLNLYGARQDNPHFLKPVFYLASPLGDDLVAYVRDLVGGDPRFFLPTDSEKNKNYNYNGNATLMSAIARGARGAYWDILRRQTAPSASSA